MVGMQSMAHELGKEGIEICGGIGVRLQNFETDELSFPFSDLA